MEAGGFGINTYSSYCKRGHLEVVKKACLGSPALVKVSSIPQKIKEAVILKFGKPEEAPKYTGFKSAIGVDPAAVQFFTNHPLVGNKLYDAKINTYIASANVLAAIHTSFTKTRDAWAKSGKRNKFSWVNMAEAVKSVYDINNLPHDLPKNERKLQEAYKLYVEVGFESLISARFGNQYALKVDERIELLLMCAYTMKNKPSTLSTHNLITLFLSGRQEIANPKTGELLNPADYTKNGQPITISDTTVWNWINKHDNRAVVDKKRMGGHRYNGVHRLHNHRHAPQFSLSKISLDDRELSRPYINSEGRTARVVQYLAYDVASGAIVGFAHSKKKDAALFEATLRNMFTMLDKFNLGLPMEFEMEQHIASQYFQKIRNLGTIVSECAPGNSQQKRAEHFNRILKYCIERPLHGAQVGRFYAKHEFYQFDRDLVNNEFVEKTYTYDRLVADALHAIRMYNNMPHPKHPNLSRWDVLLQNQNPDCPPISWQLIARNLGEVTQTSLQRNHKLQVQYAQYALPAPELLRKLKPNNNKVDAYYLRNADGTIPQLYIYQGDTFITTANRIDTYNEALAERTPADWKAFGDQNKRRAAFDGFVKTRAEQLHPIVEVHTTAATVMPAEEVQVMAAAPESDEFDLSLLSFNEDRIKQLSRKGE
jgi:hypothetical protein